MVRHDHVRAAADADLRDVDAACAASMSSSAISVAGLTTTPLPMTDVMCGYITPDGQSWSFTVSSPTTTVWPGVVAALVADDDRDVLGEEVGGLALALVAPLEADDHGRRHRPPPDTKEPRSGPGSWIHVSRDSPRAFRRAGGSKVRARLTGRTPRLPRAMVISSIAGLAPRGLEDRARVYRTGRPRRGPGGRTADPTARPATSPAVLPPVRTAGVQIAGFHGRIRQFARSACRSACSTAGVHAGRPARTPASGDKCR